MINRRYESDDWISVGVEENSHPYPDVIRWEVRDKTHSQISLDSKLCQSLAADLFILRVVSILPLLISYRDYEGIPVGSLFINLGDHGSVPGLAFCDNRANFFLIPDAAFILSRGYESLRTEGAELIPWNQRRPVGFWRGGTSGRPSDLNLGWRSLPRVSLCEISRKHPDILDAGITHVGQINAESDRELRDSGIMRPFVRSAGFTNFKYQIDIDGNSNSWSGLFQKLLSGGPVLKVASPYGYCQWYYDRLRPWVNFVSVCSDMSDLVDKIGWLREHDDAACRVGENGRALAMSLSYEGELKAAWRTIAAAARYFGGRLETELHFGLVLPVDVRLLGGWTAQREDGLQAMSQESRLDLPRPVAAESFVLSLDVSPVGGPAAPPAQRVTVVVNAETLRETVVSTRRLIRCRVPRRTIDAADRLVITLLHPDASCLASELHPLDERTLSIVLHGLTLTPVSIYAKINASAIEIYPPEPVRPDSEPFQDGPYGPYLAPPSQIGSHPDPLGHSIILGHDYRYVAAWDSPSSREC